MFVKRLPSVAIVLCALAIFALATLSAQAFEATVNGKTLEISVPNGWRKATTAEQRGLNSGLALFGTRGSKPFPSVVLPGANGTSECRGVMSVVYSPDLIELDGTTEMMETVGESLKMTFKAIDTSKPLVDNAYAIVRLLDTEFRSGAGWHGVWLHSTTVEKKRLNKTRTTYFFYGNALLKGDIYGILISMENADMKSESAFRDSAEKWMDNLASLNERQKDGRPVVRSSKSQLHDQLSVGEISSTQRCLFDIRDARDMLEGEWIKVRTLGEEKAKGVDVTLAYPKSFSKKAGNQPHVVFAFDKTDSKTGLYFHLNIAVNAMDPSLKAALALCKDEDVPQEEILDFLRTIAGQMNLRVLGGGSTTLLGNLAFWMTTANADERLGVNVKSIGRMYWIPAWGANKMISLSYSVYDPSDRSDFPVAEFLRFIPIGMQFVNLLTVNDWAQFRAEPELNASGGGTGWFATSNHVVTCWHVVKGRTDIDFQGKEGKRGKLRLVDRDEFNDLALLKVVDSRSGCPSPLSISVDEPLLAETVFTVGYPVPDLMGQDVKYTSGSVSALSGMLGDKTIMQISTPIQPGNSGGALIDENGNVVGVVQSRLAEGLGEGEALQNVNYAVKSKYAVELMRKNGVEWTRPIRGGAQKSLKENCRRAIDATVFILAK